MKKEIENMRTEQEDINNLNDLRENIHELNQKLGVFSKEKLELTQKNEVLTFQCEKALNKVSLLSGQYLDLIKIIKKKISDFNVFAIKESESFQIFKRNIDIDLNIYIEKVEFIGVFIMLFCRFHRKKRSI